MELVAVGRGLLYEELEEIHSAECEKFASLAYQDLSKAQWVKKLIP